MIGSIFSMPTPKTPHADPTEADIERGKAFGLWLRTAQARLNLKAKEAAKMAGVSETYFGLLRNDGYQLKTNSILRPSKATVEKMAIALTANLQQGLKAAGWATTEDPFKVSTPLGYRVSAEDPDGFPIDFDDESLKRVEREFVLAKARKKSD